MRISPVLIYMIILIGSSIYKMYKKTLENSGEPDRKAMTFDRNAPLSGPKMEQSVEMDDDQHYTSYDADLFEMDTFDQDLFEDRSTAPVQRVQNKVEQREKQEPVAANLKRAMVAQEQQEKMDIRKAKRRKKQVQDNSVALRPELTHENLMQGIIMAEILQPPRAKRPYRPIYMDRDE